MSAISPALLEAYRETHYEVFTDPAFTLRVGSMSDALLALHRRHGVEASAFLSACNPFSQPLDAATNGARHRALLEELARAGWNCIEGQGRHPANGWPSEASVLVLGLALPAARAFARRWEQNALLWCGPDARAQLVVVR